MEGKAAKPKEEKATARRMRTVRIRNAGMIEHKAFGAKPYKAVFNDPVELSDDQLAALDELGITYREDVAPQEEARDAPSKKSGR